MKINCPKNIKEIKIEVDENGKMTDCYCLNQFYKTGGCRNGGCIFLHVNSIRKWPLEKEN